MEHLKNVIMIHHIISAKHSKITIDYIRRQNSAEIQPKFSQNIIKDKFICSCGKEYQHRPRVMETFQKL